MTTNDTNLSKIKKYNRLLRKKIYWLIDGKYIQELRVRDISETYVFPYSYIQIGKFIYDSTQYAYRELHPNLKPLQEFETEQEAKAVYLEELYNCCQRIMKNDPNRMCFPTIEKAQEERRKIRKAKKSTLSKNDNDHRESKW